ncbi:ComF family protein [Aestuariibius insulae]|uniref:ComF family protein n=1 Tax=Aestuariibius insulae TaxID=2058287 RepID=UPI00345E5E8F
MQSVVRMVYPPQCLSCDAFTEEDFALCSDCWAETTFIAGAICNLCGVPLMGEGTPDLCCDACMTLERPWKAGRAALLYSGIGRKLVLSLKHGDRLDLAAPAARWMLSSGRDLLNSNMVVVPVPSHWSRRISRRYNQAAVLAQEVARQSGLTYHPRALIRPKRTRMLDGHSRDARFAALDGAIEAHLAYGAVVAGQSVLLVDDVMTSGATLAVATKALQDAGAEDVCILTLARVASPP